MPRRPDTNVHLVECPLHLLLRRLSHCPADRDALHLWHANSLQALGLLDEDRLPTPMAEAIISAFYMHDHARWGTP